MSLDSQIEEQAYGAIARVLNMVWGKQRERISKNIIRSIMLSMGWNNVTISKEENDDDYAN